MNLLLIEPGELAPDGRARLSGRRARHLREVLGAEPGRVLRAGVVGGAVGVAEVLSVTDAAVEISFDASAERAEPAGPLPRVDLVLALPRPKALRRILRLAATMGVGRLDLVNAWRVEKSFFDSPVLAPDAIRRELVLGAEQGGTPRLPEVAVHRLLMPFLGTLEPAAGGGGLDRHRLLAHPAVEAPIEEAAGQEARGALLAIGPEGGWIEKELGSLRELGFRAVSLGPWTLTTESAVAVALGQLALLSRIAGHGGMRCRPTTRTGAGR